MPLKTIAEYINASRQILLILDFLMILAAGALPLHTQIWRLC